MSVKMGVKMKNYNKLNLGNKDERLELGLMNTRLKKVLWAARDLVKTYKDQRTVETFRDVSDWHPKTDNEYRLPMLFKMPVKRNLAQLANRKEPCPICGSVEHCIIRFDLFGDPTNILCLGIVEADNPDLKGTLAKYNLIKTSVHGPVINVQHLPITRDHNKIRCLFAILSFLIINWWAAQKKGHGCLEFKVAELQLDRLERMVALGLGRYEIGGSLQRGYYLKEMK